MTGAIVTDIPDPPSPATIAALLRNYDRVKQRIADDELELRKLRNSLEAALGEGKHQVAGHEVRVEPKTKRTLDRARLSVALGETKLREYERVTHYTQVIVKKLE